MNTATVQHTSHTETKVRLRSDIGAVVPRQTQDFLNRGAKRPKDAAAVPHIIRSAMPMFSGFMARAVMPNDQAQRPGPRDATIATVMRGGFAAPHG
jgi:hypothetical protein